MPETDQPAQDTPEQGQAAPDTPEQDQPAGAPDAAARAMRMRMALDMLDTLIDLDGRLAVLEAAAGLT